MSAEYKRITNGRINEVRRQITLLANQYKITYVDLHPVFEDGTGQLNKA